jgi:hypothetical protein
MLSGHQTSVAVTLAECHIYTDFGTNYCAVVAGYAASRLVSLSGR